MILFNSILMNSLSSKDDNNSVENIEYNNI